MLQLVTAQSVPDVTVLPRGFLPQGEPRDGAHLKIPMAIILVPVTWKSCSRKPPARASSLTSRTISSSSGLEDHPFMNAASAVLLSVAIQALRPTKRLSLTSARMPSNKFLNSRKLEDFSDTRNPHEIVGASQAAWSRIQSPHQMHPHPHRPQTLALLQVAQALACIGAAPTKNCRKAATSRCNLGTDFTTSGASNAC